MFCSPDLSYQITSNTYLPRYEYLKTLSNQGTNILKLLVTKVPIISKLLVTKLPTLSKLLVTKVPTI